MKIVVTLAVLILISCKEAGNIEPSSDSLLSPAKEIVYKGDTVYIETGDTTPQQLLAFAATLTGISYKYGSADPYQGFDCSGFITYVFNHFNITVPRTSAGFTNAYHEIKIEETKPGDIILFTGTDSTIRTVGHMGIITVSDGEEMQFIHSSSGKANGVTVTPFNTYYKGRFVKIIRVFKQNDKL